MLFNDWVLGVKCWGGEVKKELKNEGDHLGQLWKDSLLTDSWKKTTNEVCEIAGETFIYFQVQFLSTPAQQKSSKDREK